MTILMSPLSEHVQRQIEVMMEDDNVETGERVMLAYIYKYKW